ncbi:hypothetical protein [Nocardiopsis suaedae]|uniref:Uncharacterized protein n=1 Tax=Nocardiopsis suaedae TaxID=3018444 RepID=A0ABT4TII5_9ACTN|nr:hypothetical protein [Nocardiopsis suaedae]MDA2804465.1 hypothetical protein [Nocardiopsis suaedae]
MRMTFVKAPPPDAYQPRQKRSPHHEIARALRNRPGTWARISGHPTRSTACSVASGIRSGQSKGGARAYQPSGAFEARYVTTQDGRHEVYARYIGPRSGEEAR